MTFQDCELAILRHQVDMSEEIANQGKVNGPEINKMIGVVEDFLIRKKLVCYGGTAINNILPKTAQFYNREVEIPDYDFYSSTPLEDAKELADIFYKLGYEDVEAKAGSHFGTFKVFVNFIPMADITLLPKPLFESVKKEAVTIAGIKYAPPNFLRMNMFLELSRPAGDVSRWEKVLKRLTLLNTHYPFTTDKTKCSTVDFQRKMETAKYDSEKIYLKVRDTFIDIGVVFFGGFANSLYAKYMPKDRKKKLAKIPDFDVLSEEPEKTATIVVEQLTSIGIADVSVIQHDAVGEIIPYNLEIRVGPETIAFIYKPFGCVSYNKVIVQDKEVKIAAIDTMLTYYLAFYYVDKPYYQRDRILCMSMFLFDIQQKNRLAQKGVLKRFSTDCYGKQETLDDIRAKKSDMFKELKDKKGTREYDEWFLKYNPADILGKRGLPKSSDHTKESSPKPDIKNIVASRVKLYSKTPGKTPSPAPKKRRTVHRKKPKKKATRRTRGGGGNAKTGIINTVNSLYNNINQLTLPEVEFILSVKREQVLESVEELARQLSETTFFIPGSKDKIKNKMNSILAKVKDLLTMDRFEKVPLDEYQNLKKEVEYFEIVEHEFVSLGKFQRYSIVISKELLDLGAWFDVSWKQATFERKKIFVHVSDDSIFFKPTQLYVLKEANHTSEKAEEESHAPN